MVLAQPMHGVPHLVLRRAAEDVRGVTHPPGFLVVGEAQPPPPGTTVVAPYGEEEVNRLAREAEGGEGMLTGFPGIPGGRTDRLESHQAGVPDWFL
jgi:hypothetical protein